MFMKIEKGIFYSKLVTFRIIENWNKSIQIIIFLQSCVKTVISPTIFYKIKDFHTCDA